MEKREIFRGKFRDLGRFIEVEVSKSACQFRKQGILFVGTVMKIDGKSHVADYIPQRIRPYEFNKIDPWIIGFRLSIVMQKLTGLAEDDYCTVGLMIKDLGVDSAN